MIRLIFLLKLHERKDFIRTLAKLEYGVSAFCMKLSKQAEIDSLHMSLMFEKHAQEERRHGKMLAAYVDGKDKICLETNGIFLYKDVVDNPPESLHKTSTVKTVYWDSVKCSGKFGVGLFENLDGISDRYLSARIFFGGKKASEYDWSDKIAFMNILEDETQKFYSRLLLVVKDKVLENIMKKILEDESKHTGYLKSLSLEFNSDLEKWRSRLWFASLFLIWDIANEYIRYTTTNSD